MKALQRFVSVVLFTGFFMLSCGYSSYLEEDDASVKNGDTYKRYEYPFTLTLSKKKLLGWDIELYKYTPAWALAKAVYEQDTARIHKICTKKKSLLSFREELFGMTLLEWAVLNNRYFSARALLLEGADPNARSSPICTPFLEAAEKKETSNYLKLLLKFDGRVNDVCANSDYDVTPLKLASTSYLESVKILVAAGANINFNTDGYSTALSWAMIAGKLDIALYLIENGADYTLPIWRDAEREDAERTLYLVDFLKLSESEYGSEEYKLKEKIIEYMATHKQGKQGDTLSKK